MVKWMKALSKDITNDDIEAGSKHEYKEHSDSMDYVRLIDPYKKILARRIAIDHLQEDPKYYQKLKRVGL
jgi:hypothetical protein